LPHKSFSEFYVQGVERGSGSFGTVYEAKRVSDGKMFAAKIFMGPPVKNDVNECMFLTKIQDLYTLGCDEYFINTDFTKYPQLVIITELAIQDLQQYIMSISKHVVKEEDGRTAKENQMIMKEEEIIRIISQVVMGFEYLHKHNITHRDLKPENILLFADFRVKISDFGLSKLINNTTVSRVKSMTGVGTPVFMAPEILGKIRGVAPKPFKTDIYSLGMTVYYMMTMQYADMVEIHQKTLPFPKEYSQELKDFVYFLLRRLPDERPTISEVL